MAEKKRPGRIYPWEAWSRGLHQLYDHFCWKGDGGWVTFADMLAQPGCDDRCWVQRLRKKIVRRSLRRDKTGRRRADRLALKQELRNLEQELP